MCVVFKLMSLTPRLPSEAEPTRSHQQRRSGSLQQQLLSHADTGLPGVPATRTGEQQGRGSLRGRGRGTAPPCCTRTPLPEEASCHLRGPGAVKDALGAASLARQLTCPSHLCLHVSSRGPCKSERGQVCWGNGAYVPIWSELAVY